MVTLAELNQVKAQEEQALGEQGYIPQGHDLTSISRKISDVVLTRPTGWGFLTSFGFALSLLLLFGGVIVYLLVMGVGIWGIDIPVAWGFSITDFVWWIGIGHAGTLISAILLLLHQRWRTSINRISEAMTIFALMCPACFRCYIWEGPGSFIGCCPIPTPCIFGRSFAARWSGTCSP